MNPVEFVSAGAGSGKTYRLTQIVSAALAEGSARPQGILATTFTIKAAAELRERARAKLLETGRVDLASAVGQARIGTVNSVCGELLSRFCFEVGMSPDQVVLDKPQADQLLKATLASTLDDADRAELMALNRRFAFKDDDWAKPVAAIVDAARENVISGDALRTMGQANADAMLANWPATVEGVDYEKNVVTALGVAVDAIQVRVDEMLAANKKLFKYMLTDIDDLRSRQRQFVSGDWSWQTWASTATLEEGGAKLADLFPPVREAATVHARHPQFHADVRRYLRLVFSLAADALDAYAEVKRIRGALDFGDQGVLLLKMLRESDEARQALADELDLVVVDEFQDTNPLQLAIFVELARLAKRSVWVGDPKQAIYAFRGTDPTLIARIVDAIEGWGGKLGEPLTKSRRSTPSLVSLANAVFENAFSPVPAEAVRLTPSREDIGDRHVSLHNWSFESRYPTTDHVGLGVAVTELLAGGHQVMDKRTEVLRPLVAGDIAILCRYNNEVATTVASLSRCGIPSASGRPGLLSTPEAMFVMACLRRLQDPTDTVASALIVSLSNGSDHAEWLNHRLKFLAAEGKAHQWQATGETAHAVLGRLEELRPRLRALTPSEALRLAKAESHIAELASRWSSSAQEAGMRIANVEALVELAGTYENECVSARQPATVGGLLQWMRKLSADEMDFRAVAAEGAVSVLTHHSAKGLEWPVVVLTGLGTGARTSLWNVRARTNGSFDAEQPLHDRFVHYWPFPYGSCNSPPAAAAAEESELGKAMMQAGRDENLRLLYVSMTRARDAMVLASTNRGKAPLAWLDEVGATDILIGDTGPVALVDGRSIVRSSRRWTKDECEALPEPAEPQDLSWYQKGQVVPPRPLWFSPSGAQGGDYRRAELETVGERIAIKAAVDMEALGEAIHLCIAKAGAHGSIRLEEVAHIVARWGVSDAVASDAVLAQMHAFQAWLEKRWPGCQVLVEVPIEVNLEDGVRLRGRIDFLVETPAGWVLIDHKANPRGAASDDRLVQKHGQQLEAYADALTRATARPVIEKWLFLPVAAQAVQVEQVHAVVRAA